MALQTSEYDLRPKKRTQYPDSWAMPQATVKKAFGQNAGVILELFLSWTAQQ
jgi:hypothetical protein